MCLGAYQLYYQVYLYFRVGGIILNRLKEVES